MPPASQQTAPAARTAKFKAVSSTSATPIEDKNRKKVALKLPSCWIEDYEKEISTRTTGRYSQTFDENGTAHGYNFHVQYKISLAAKSNTEVMVELRLKAFFILDAVTLLQADGSRRALHGLCTEAAWLGADGGGEDLTDANATYRHFLFGKGGRPLAQLLTSSPERRIGTKRPAQPN